MTTTTSATPPPGKKSLRPTVWRILASKYVDLLTCGFISWIICATFGIQSYWATLTLVIWMSEVFWCRDRLNPTAGEYCLGIRYLTSSSSQVVADIQVIHAKLKLNPYLLSSGVVELTLAILFLCGWTVLGKAVFLGFAFGPPLSLVYWVGAGFAFFLCSGYLLSGSKAAFWAVPIVHLAIAFDFFISYPAWKQLLQSDSFYPPWVSEAVIHIAKYQSFFLLELFALWSFFVVLTLIFSRKHLIN